MKTIDNFLYPDLYERLIRDINVLSYRFIDGAGEAKKFEANLDESVCQRIKQCYEDKVAKAEGFFSAGVVRCGPEYQYHIHYDHPSKLVSSVVYLCPEIGNGTYFLKEDRGDQGKVMEQIVWRPNRLVIWRNTGQLHFYHNKTKEPRYTLNIYQKKNDKVFEVTKQKEQS